MNWYKLANFQIFEELTGIPDYDELINNPEKINETNYDSAEIVYMSPDDYLDEIKLGFWNKLPLDDKIKYQNISNFWNTLGQSRLNQSKINTFYQKALENTKFHMPYIIYNENGKMTQEGHHRVEVAKKMKIPSIPVFIINKKYKQTDDSLYSEDYQLEKKVTNYLESNGIIYMVNLLNDILNPEDFFIEKNVRSWWNNTITDMMTSATSFNEYLNLNNIYKAIKKMEINFPDVIEEVNSYMSKLNFDSQTMSPQQWIKLMEDLDIFGDFLSLFDYKVCENYMTKIGMTDMLGFPTEKGVNMIYDIEKTGGGRLLEYPSTVAEEAYHILFKGYISKDKQKTEKLFHILQLSSKKN